MKSEDVVTVDVVTNPLEAEMVANALRAEGIACTAEGVGQPGVTGGVEVRILVKAWDADRARNLLKAARRMVPAASYSPKQAQRKPRLTKSAASVQRRRITAKARRGVSPT